MSAIPQQIPAAIATGTLVVAGTAVALLSTKVALIALATLLLVGAVALYVNRHRSKATQIAPTIINAMMPGKVTQLFVAIGAVVRKGDMICELERMKMFGISHAAVAGRVTQLCVQLGQVVQQGTPLYHIVPSGE